MWVTEVEQDCVANARNNNSKHVSNNGEKKAEKTLFYSSLPNFESKMLTLHLCIIILFVSFQISLRKEPTLKAILAV